MTKDEYDDEEEFSEALRKTGFWGSAGSGCLPFSKQTGRFLVAKRSEGVLEPNTWGTWGGAIPNHLTPEENVFVELAEETMFEGEADLVHVYTFKDERTGFTYHNYLAVMEEEFEPQLNWENCDFGWFEQKDFPEPFHPGLRALLENTPDLTSLVAECSPKM